MKHILIMVFMVSFMNTYSQQIFAEFGKNSSYFDYTNSSGGELDNLFSKSNTYIGFGYRDVINRDKTLFVSIGVNYQKYGAIGSDRTLDNFFEWEISYAGLQAAVDYRIFRLRDFSFYFKGSVSGEFLIEGTQTVNNQVFNLVGEDEFNSYFFFLKGGLMVTYPLSRTAFLTANYSFGKSTQLNEGNSEDKEKLNLQVHQFGIGFIINLPYCNCPY